jgi:hypothetical protein
VALGRSLVLGRWVAYAYPRLGWFVVWVVSLDLAQERIRELVRARNQQPPVKYI